MKLPIVLAVIVLAASLVGFVQNRELAALRERSAELAAEDGIPLGGSNTGEAAGSIPGGSREGGGGDGEGNSVAVVADVLVTARTPFVPSPSVDMAARDFVRRAEEAVKAGSMVQVATKLVPELNRASPEMLKAVLLHLETADVPDDGRLMGYSTILSKLVKTEPAEAVAGAMDVVARLGVARAGKVFRTVVETWAANDPDGIERWFETAKREGVVPVEPVEIYGYLAAEVAGIVARRDLDAAWAMIEADAGHERTRPMMLDRMREEIGSVADWEKMADYALGASDEDLGRLTAWTLAGPNFKYGTSEEQLAHADRVAERYPGVATIYAERALKRAGATGSAELAEWALPRVHEAQRRGLIEHHIGVWAKRDREAVAEWVATMESGELRELVQGALDGA